MDPDLSDQKPAPRKLRFQPKRPKHKVTTAVVPKSEVTDDAESAEAKELMRRFQENLAAKPKVEKKVEPVRVAFGYGAAQSHQYNGIFPKYEDKARSTLKDEKDCQEPWDYYGYYPTVVPLRRPYSGNPELLDKEEFGQISTFDETKINLAEELGLMEVNPEPRMLFFQLPKNLPMSKRAATAAVEVSDNNSKPISGANLADIPCGFNELKSGIMGKMLVYKSGAVKLKLGETVYDVTPGSDCGFAQDAVAIDAEKKHCCVVGEISKHAIVTPDVDCILDSFADTEL